MKPEDVAILKQLPDEAIAFLCYAAQAQVDQVEHRLASFESYQRTASTITNVLSAEYAARGLDQSDFYKDY